MTRIRYFVLAAMVLLSTHVLAMDDDSPSNYIFGKVMSTYKSMQTYKAQGTVLSDIDTGAIKMNIKTSFSIILQKPNLYLISWTQENMPMPGMSQSGAVWSDGTQPYLYMGVMKAYSKMSSDEIALSSATGISSGAALTIPSLFLSVFGQSDPFSRLKDPIIEKTEKVGEEDCYVISGASTISKKETFWISKEKYLILKYSRSLELPAERMEMPEMTDEQLTETLKGAGQEVTEENKQKMREMTNKTREILKTIKGSFTETHMEISSPKMSKKDFQFALPEGTVLKDALF